MSTSTVSRKAGKKPDQVIVNTIVVKQTQRKSQDIANWRTAIKNFENLLNPSRVLLYDMYEDIELDGQIETVWGKRRDAILNKDLLFVKDGKEDEELGKLLNSPSMRELLEEMLKTIAWGYTLIQVNSVDWNEDEEQYVIDWELVPRKHVHPERGFECVSKDQQTASRDILYKEPPLSKYMIWAGKQNDMGLLVRAAQYVIYKRGGFGDWAQYAEIFGMPFREGTYNGFDVDTRRKLEDALENMGGAGWMVKPEGTEIKIHENSSASGSSSLYKDLKDACNAEISKIFLGNTLTTEQGDKGTQALGTVHKDVEDQKTASDAKFILALLNGKFRAILKAFGFNVQGGSIWFRSPDKDWDHLQKKWSVVSGIATKVPIDDDYIYEEFDIPKPENYDELKEQMRQAPQELAHELEHVFRKPAKAGILGKALNFFV
jgi:phage gp29-like protein